MKLKNTQALTSFNYGWLLKRIFPYINKFLGRVILGFLVAIPVGLLDGVVSFSLKPYMDYVVGKQNLIIFGHEINYIILAYSMPFAIVLFAVLQGLLRYLNSYLTDWTSLKITNAVKTDLFSKLVFMDTSFFDENSSGMIINRYLIDPDTASRGIVDQIKTIITLFVLYYILYNIVIYNRAQEILLFIEFV